MSRCSLPALAPPCRTEPSRWLDAARAAEAAPVCERCPLVEACLRHALHIDIAYRQGRDPYGVHGTYGSVWFEPGHAPRALHTAPTAEPSSTPVDRVVAGSAA